MAKWINKLLDRFRRPIPMEDLTEDPRLKQLRQNLKIKLKGDDAAVDREIEVQRKRHPNASEMQLYEFAIEGWERDNR